MSESTAAMAVHWSLQLYLLLYLLLLLMETQTSSSTSAGATRASLPALCTGRH